MKKNMGDKAYLIPMFSAPVSEFFALLSYMPFEIIRTRLQINSIQYRYNSIFDGIK